MDSYERNTRNDAIALALINHVIETTPDIEGAFNILSGKIGLNKTDFEYFNIHAFDQLMKEEQTVTTNIGEIPIEDYREIVAMQNGFDSYADMRKQGFKFGNEYDDPAYDFMQVS